MLPKVSIRRGDEMSYVARQGSPCPICNGQTVLVEHCQTCADHQSNDNSVDIRPESGPRFFRDIKLKMYIIWNILLNRYTSSPYNNTWWVWRSEKEPYVKVLFGKDHFYKEE